ncbi:MAG: tRNA guanosine(34) transglycosylase Tgt [Bdellovibrionales bacterium]|nr:tRNA guanosine(34) transglycosylase Tgt [Bdellovibrionales bacterium]
MSNRFTQVSQLSGAGVSDASAVARHDNGAARLGVYETPHGTFQTPNFMAVGTKASVKGLDTGRLFELGCQIALVNTFHLTLRPGEQVVQNLGGIHRFMGWDGPILSDSGGFQVFSLSKIRRVEEEGVHFQSPIDGSPCFLSPERSIAIQETLGVDIAMGFDECPPSDLSFDDTAKSLAMTHRWLKRSLDAKSRPEMSLFAITQGGLHDALRTESAQHLRELPFDGYAIGGLSVGETQEEMYRILSFHPAELPQDRIRYLMGVGTPEDIVEAVYRGIDLFDCVMPTRAGRFGRAFVSGDEPTINIKNARFKEDVKPLDEACSCFACRRYSRGYLHHLFRAEEMLGPQMLSLHNLHYYMEWLATIREAIHKGQLAILRESERARWRSAKEDGRLNEQVANQ